MSKTLTILEEQLSEELTSEWTVIIFNNESTSVDEVIAVLMVATDCSFEEAETECMEAHITGQCRVHYADQVECERIAAIINLVGVKTEVCKEWGN